MLWVFLTLLSLSFAANAAVNINTATQAELQSLSGIGPVKAQAIIDYRKKNGAFKSVDDLEKVDGIGTATMTNLKKQVTVSGKSSTATPTAIPSAKDPKPAVKDVKAVGVQKAASNEKQAVQKK